MRGSFQSFLIFTVVLFFSLTSNAQPIISELNGFHLGQFRAVTHSELGEPDDLQTSGEYAYEVYFLTEEPPLYLVFQYHKSEPQIIYSIQWSGEDKSIDPGFRGLRLGATPEEVEKALGKPSKKIEAGEDRTRWEFEGANYSVEIMDGKKLSSIRIVDERVEGRDPDVKALPKFDEVKRILQKGSNAEIAAILSPGVEVYEGGNVLYFKHKMKPEVADDQSKVFSTIRKLAKELSGVDRTKSDEYDEVGRFRYGRDVLHVLKFSKLKGINEIVFMWTGRKWVIWEIGKESPDNDNSWMNRYEAGSLKNLATEKLPNLIANPNVLMKGPDGKPLLSLSYNSFPTRTTVVFTGETRKTSERRIKLLEFWLTTLGRAKSEAKLFENELRFVENGETYWLPVQSTLLPNLKTEVKNGDTVEIYVAWVGAEYVDEKPISLAVVNEFIANSPQK